MSRCHPDGAAYRASARARTTLTAILILAWLSAVVSSEAKLTISEFLASNQSAGFDEDGDSSDWLEIYNGGADPVNLGGWYLTDRADNLTKWSFPPVVINPDSYLVVFASGKDRRDPDGELHTNFKIGADGEYLGLVHPDGVTVADAYAPTFPPQFADVSYGRIREIEGETVQLGFMAEPTPGLPNSVGFRGFTSEPGVTHEGGFFDAPISVSLLPVEPTDIIYYTLDTSTPGPENGGIADGPIQVSATSVLRAVAHRLGHEPSAVITHTYLFIDDVMRQSPNGSAPPGFPSRRINNKQMNYGMDPDIVNDPLYGPQLRDALLDLPSVSIVTDPANLFDPETGIYVNSRGEGRAWERPASFELLHPDGTEGFQVNAGLRIRGGASRGPNNPKHSFRFIFRREYGPGMLRYPLFGSEGVEEFDKIDLRSNQNFVWHRNLSRAPENTYLRDVLSRDTERDMGHTYSRSRYYHLYLNGQYWGLFQSEERIDPDFAASYQGGVPGDYDFIKVDRGFIQTPNGWRGKGCAVRNLRRGG